MIQAKITANELRIGNLIGFIQSNPDAEVKVLPFKIAAEDILEISLGSNVLPYQPLELTEEWLIKFGFRYDDTNGYYCKGLMTHYLEFIVSSDGYHPACVQVPEMSPKNEQRVGLNRINYVHQLQNLFYFLIGEELTLNAEII